MWQCYQSTGALNLWSLSHCFHKTSQLCCKFCSYQFQFWNSQLHHGVHYCRNCTQWGISGRVKLMTFFGIGNQAPRSKSRIEIKLSNSIYFCSYRWWHSVSGWCQFLSPLILRRLLLILIANGEIVTTGFYREAAIDSTFLWVIYWPV